MKYTQNKSVLEEDLCWVAQKVKDMGMGECTVLVTGATGLIGSLFLKSLLMANRLYQTNIRCIGLVRSLEKAEKVFSDFMDSEYLDFYETELLAGIKVEEPVDYLVHFASVTASKEFVTKPVETIELTYSGTKFMLELARQKKISSMVYISSMEIFGITDTDLSKVKEENLGYIDILNVRSCYSEGKRIAECMCACYWKEYGVPVKMARLAQTFGAGIGKKENRVFAQFAKSAMAGTDIILHTTGESMGNYCYTRDCIWGILTILLKGKSGEAYTVANEESNIMIREMAQMVLKEFGKAGAKVVFDIPEDKLKFGYAPDVKMCLSSEKLRQLGWEAQIGLRDSYERMICQMQMEREEQ